MKTRVKLKIVVRKSFPSPLVRLCVATAEHALRVPRSLGVGGSVLRSFSEVECIEWVRAYGFSTKFALLICCLGSSLSGFTTHPFKSHPKGFDNLFAPQKPATPPPAEDKNLDACKVEGDPCVCSNTGWGGFCLPGWLSKTDTQLYCDCTSDVLSLDEIITLIIQAYLDPRNMLIRKTIHDQCPKTAQVLDEIGSIIGGKPPLEKAASSLIDSQRAELVPLMHEEKYLLHFFVAKDGCYYPGQECNCKFGGRKGACSISQSSTFLKPYDIIPGTKLGILLCNCS